MKLRHPSNACRAKAAPRRWTWWSLLTMSSVALMAAASGRAEGSAGTAEPPPLPGIPESLPATLTGDAPAVQRAWSFEARWALVGYTDRVFNAADTREAVSRGQRVALDVRREPVGSQGWRWGLSNRIETVGIWRADAGAAPRDRTINILREAWASLRLGPAAEPMYLDAGRINWRLGVAGGYNPSDFFKSRAVRSQTSQDPAALRAERLGTFMLRGQWLQSGGAWSLAVAPRLTERDAADEGSYSLATQRTNRQGALLLRWAPRLGERGTLDLQLFRRERERVQLAGNATWLASDALVLYTEFAVGQRPLLVGPEATAAPRARRERLALGGTYTLPAGLELTLELQRAADALSRGDWNAWRAAAAAATQQRLGALARERAALQEPLVRAGWFARVGWREPFGITGLDLAALVQANAYDDSRLWQLKGTQHLGGPWSASLLAGALSGRRDSEYGASGLKSYVSAQLSAAF